MAGLWFLLEGLAPEIIKPKKSLKIILCPFCDYRFFAAAEDGDTIACPNCDGDLHYEDQ